jgi:hypothetical protein
MGSALRVRILLILAIAAPLAGVLVSARPVMGQTPPPSGNVTSSGTAAPGTAAPGGVVAPQPLPPSPEFGFEESLPLLQGGIREQESFPEQTRGVYAPAFVRGGSGIVRTSQTSGMRMGLSGWTATRIPFDDRNNGGGPALGFSLEWGKPLPPPAEPTKADAPAQPR